MSMGPEPQLGDTERLNWEGIPSELEGRVVSLEELKKLFPAEGGVSEVGVLEDNKNYRVYGRKRGEMVLLPLLAYECKRCNAFVIGPPKITDEDSIHSGRHLTGRRGYDIYCSNCNAHIKEFTFERS
jgi:hypothetical protein